jgi:hypothetical protein
LDLFEEAAGATGWGKRRPARAWHRILSGIFFNGHRFGYSCKESSNNEKQLDSAASCLHDKYRADRIGGWSAQWAGRDTTETRQNTKDAE